MSDDWSLYAFLAAAVGEPAYSAWLFWVDTRRRSRAAFQSQTIVHSGAGPAALAKKRFDEERTAQQTNAKELFIEEVSRRPPAL
jgi:hypothetical protein